MSTRTRSPFPTSHSWIVDPPAWPRAIAALLLCTAGAVSAQTAPVEPKMPTEFPPDAMILAPQALQQRLEGKAFTATLVDGTGWRLDYRGEYVFVNVSTGPNDKGKWRVQGSQVCTDYERFPSGCSEMRASATRLYLKRPSTGEVVAMDVVR